MGDSSINLDIEKIDAPNSESRLMINGEIIDVEKREKIRHKFKNIYKRGTHQILIPEELSYRRILVIIYLIKKETCYYYN